jgi:hypothetical protein
MLANVLIESLDIKTWWSGKESPNRQVKNLARYKPLYGIDNFTEKWHNTWKESSSMHDYTCVQSLLGCTLLGVLTCIITAGPLLGVPLACIIAADCRGYCWTGACWNPAAGPNCCAGMTYRAKLTGFWLLEGAPSPLVPDANFSNKNGLMPIRITYKHRIHPCMPTAWNQNRQSFTEWCLLSKDRNRNPRMDMHLECLILCLLSRDTCVCWCDLLLISLTAINWVLTYAWNAEPAFVWRDERLMLSQHLRGVSICMRDERLMLSQHLYESWEANAESALILYERWEANAESTFVCS